MDGWTIEEILEENGRRMAKMHAPYDPLAGSDPMKVDHSRCLRDFEYWAARCCRIHKKGGGEEIPFILNAPQRKLVKELELQRTTGQPIRIILLKARQWGGSTCTQMYMAWLQMVHMEGLNSLIVAQNHACTAEIKDMFVTMLKNSQGWEEEPRTGKKGKKKGHEEEARKRSEGAGPGAIRVIDRNFKVKVGSAERPDTCRGGDYSLVHCSEVALWKKTKLRTPEDMIRASCSGVLYRPLTMIVLESTANGTGNYFHGEYQAAVRGESQFKPVFIAWFEIEQYSLPMDNEEKNILAQRLLEGKDSEQADSERDLPGKYLWWLWEKGATLEGIKWYLKESRKYSDHGHMASEYPSDDIEAFVHSGTRVFDRYKVETLRADCRAPEKRGEITGEKPSGPDSLKNVKFSEDSQGGLKIWKFPEEEEPYIRTSDRYLTVVDIGGRSRNSDWSVITVFDRLPMLEGRGPEVAAQWRGHTDFDLLTWNAARIARFYKESLLVIESNTLETHDIDRLVEGDQSHYLLNQLKLAYQNLYARKQKPEDIRQGAPVKYGFHTNIITKPLIITNLVQVVREGLYTERDEQCLDEYLTYEQRQDGSYGAVSGKHDDLLMTRAIGLHVCMHEMRMPKRIMGETGYRQKPGGYASF